MTPKELVEAIKNKPFTEDDARAFVARIKKREALFAKEADRMKPDASFYNFQYGVKNART